MVSRHSRLWNFGKSTSPHTYGRRTADESCSPALKYCGPLSNHHHQTLNPLPTNDKKKNKVKTSIIGDQYGIIKRVASCWDFGPEQLPGAFFEALWKPLHGFRLGRKTLYVLKERKQLSILTLLAEVGEELPSQ